MPVNFSQLRKFELSLALDWMLTEEARTTLIMVKVKIKN